MIALPFPQEAWQGDKILIYLLINSPMKSPTFVKQGLLGLFWRKESNNRALFAKLLWHRKLCTTFNILERLISENFLLQSRVPDAYVTQYHPILMSARQVLQSYALLRIAHFDARCAAYCVAGWWTWMALRLVSMDAITTVLIAYFCNASVVISDHP